MEDVKDEAKATLEKEKLAAEIFKLKVETAKLELETKEYMRGVEWRNTARDRRGQTTGVYEYTFADSIYDESVHSCIATLSSYVSISPEAHILLTIDSPGGNIFSGLALYDYLQMLKARGHMVTTQSVGMAASMGGVLLQAGTHRLMGRNGFMLIHEASTWVQGKSSAIADEVRLLDLLQGKLAGILSERTIYTPAEITKKWERTDWWLDAQECLASGLIDGYIEDWSPGWEPTPPPEKKPRKRKPRT